METSKFVAKQEEVWGAWEHPGLAVDIWKWEQVGAVLWDWAPQPVRSVLTPDSTELWDIKLVSENCLWKDSGRSIIFRILKLVPEEKAKMVQSYFSRELV